MPVHIVHCLNGGASWVPVGERAVSMPGAVTVAKKSFMLCTPLTFSLVPEEDADSPDIIPLENSATIPIFQGGLETNYGLGWPSAGRLENSMFPLQG